MPTLVLYDRGMVQPAHTEPPPHIVFAGGRPVVRGTDIKVSQIASEHEHHGMSADEIVEAHPHLTLSDVHSALSYYFDHPDAIAREWHDAREIIATLRKRYANHGARGAV